jgi:hypothetical protein
MRKEKVIVTYQCDHCGKGFDPSLDTYSFSHDKGKYVLSHEYNKVTVEFNSKTDLCSQCLGNYLITFGKRIKGELE